MDALQGLVGVRSCHFYLEEIISYLISFKTINISATVKSAQRHRPGN